MSRRRRDSNAFNYSTLEPKQLLATLTVDTLADSGSLAADGQISLREAVLAANFDAVIADAPAGTGVDRIEFAPALAGQTIQLTAGELRIMDGLTIAGDVQISGSGLSRIFHVDTTDAVTFESLELVDGSANIGGAIYTIVDSEVRIDGVTFHDNVASTGNASGGAVFNAGGQLTVTDSIFRDNVADGGSGGAIHSARTPGSETQIIRSTFTNNESTEFGGAVSILDGQLSILNSEFTNNEAVQNNLIRATQGGGALYVADDVAPGYIGNTTFSGNSTDGSGGAINNEATLFVDNATFTGNSSTDAGGAIFSSGFLTSRTQFGGRIDTAVAGDFHDNSSGGNGGAIAVDEGTLVLTGSLSFTENNANTGGAISVVDGEIRAHDTGFIRNASTAGGGAISSDVSTGTLIDTLYIDNTAQFGGGLQADGSFLAVAGNRTRFQGNFINSPSTGGGGIHVTATTLTVAGSQNERLRFENNTAQAIYAEGSETTVRWALFEDNAQGASTDGGAIQVDGGSARVFESVFNSNGGQNGGAISVTDSQDVSIGESRFNGNSSVENGGAIAIDETSVVNVHDSTFFSNSSDGGGGALHNLGELTLQDNRFLQNSIGQNGNSPDGGGVLLNEGDTRVFRSTFLNNESAGRGAAIMNTGLLTVREATFNGNVMSAFANPDAGGAIYSSGGVVDLQDTVFVSNSGLTGGAISVDGGSLFAIRSRFGGATLASGNAATSTVSNSTGLTGGAIYAAGDAQLHINESRFLNNQADALGGAIAIEATNAAQAPIVFVSNSNFSSNNVPNPGFVTIQANGGAIANLGGDLIVRNSLFTANIAWLDGGALFGDADSTTQIRDSFFGNNDAVRGAGDDLSSDGSLTVTGSFDRAIATTNFRPIDADDLIQIDSVFSNDTAAA